LSGCFLLLELSSPSLTGTFTLLDPPFNLHHIKPQLSEILVNIIVKAVMTRLLSYTCSFHDRFMFWLYEPDGCTRETLTDIQYKDKTTLFSLALALVFLSNATDFQVKDFGYIC
jgi:hypothetical protein